MKVLARRITLLFLLTSPAFVFAGNYSLGEPANPNLEMWSYSQPYNSAYSFAPGDQLLINSASPQVNKAIIMSALNNGTTLILDNSALSEQIRMSRVSELLGVGFNAPIIIAVKQNGKLKVSVLNINKTILPTTIGLSSKHAIKDSVSEKTTSSLTTEEMAGSYQLTSTQVNQQVNKLIADITKTTQNYNSSVATNPLYLPEKEIEIRLSELNFTCILHATKHINENNNMLDFCNNSASADLNYNLSMMRSIEANKPGGGKTKNAKYVRVSVSEDAGTGAGIHLRESLLQDNTWYNSSIWRDTRIGPFAESYAFVVKPISGTKPVIVVKSPENENPEYKHTQTNSVSVGVNGSAGATIGSEGPEMGAEVSASYSYSNERSMEWDSKEYAIKNSTTGSIFRVSWERSLSDCQELVDLTVGCSFIQPLGWNNPMWDVNKFSPIAYANFTPNFDVLYEVSSNERGSTVFELAAYIKSKARYGVVRPAGPLGVFEPAAWSAIVNTLKTQVTVNWDDPVFKPEPHVNLRALSKDNMCLQVNFNRGQPAQVVGSPCDDGIRQKWGLDDQNRYKTMYTDEQCLERLTDNTLTVAACNRSLSQQWSWDKVNHKLYSLYANGTGQRYLLTIGEDHSIHTALESEANPHRVQWRAELTNPSD